VRDKDGQTVQFYQDGAPVGTTHFINAATFPNGADMMVGNYGFQNDPGACEFNGDIDELKIYGIALPAASIKHEYDDVSLCSLNFTPVIPCESDPNCPGPILRRKRGAANLPSGDSGPSPSVAADATNAPLRPDPAITTSGTVLHMAHAVVGGGTLTIFDVSGRVVQEFEVPRGARSARWDGKDSAGTNARPGMYLVRLRSLGAYSWARVVVVH
jgi:hypothetical protein